MRGGPGAVGRPGGDDHPQQPLYPYRKRRTATGTAVESGTAPSAPASASLPPRPSLPHTEVRQARPRAAGRRLPHGRPTTLSFDPYAYATSIVRATRQPVPPPVVASDKAPREEPRGVVVEAVEDLEETTREGTARPSSVPRGPAPTLRSLSPPSPSPSTDSPVPLLAAGSGRSESPDEDASMGGSRALARLAFGIGLGDDEVDVDSAGGGEGCEGGASPCGSPTAASVGTPLVQRPASRTALRGLGQSAPAAGRAADRTSPSLLVEEMEGGNGRKGADTATNAARRTLFRYPLPTADETRETPVRGSPTASTSALVYVAEGYDALREFVARENFNMCR